MPQKQLVWSAADEGLYDCCTVNVQVWAKHMTHSTSTVTLSTTWSCWKTLLQDNISGYYLWLHTCMTVFRGTPALWLQRIFAPWQLSISQAFPDLSADVIIQIQATTGQTLCCCHLCIMGLSSCVWKWLSRHCSSILAAPCVVPPESTRQSVLRGG